MPTSPPLDSPASRRPPIGRRRRAAISPPTHLAPKRSSPSWAAARTPITALAPALIVHPLARRPLKMKKSAPVGGRIRLAPGLVFLQIVALRGAWCLPEENSHQGFFDAPWCAGLLAEDSIYTRLAVHGNRIVRDEDFAVLPGRRRPSRVHVLAQTSTTAATPAQTPARLHRDKHAPWGRPQKGYAGEGHQSGGNKWASRPEDYGPGASPIRSPSSRVGFAMSAVTISFARSRGFMVTPLSVTVSSSFTPSSALASLVPTMPRIQLSTRPRSAGSSLPQCQSGSGALPVPPRSSTGRGTNRRTSAVSARLLAAAIARRVARAVSSGGAPLPDAALAEVAQTRSARRLRAYFFGSVEIRTFSPLELACTRGDTTPPARIAAATASARAWPSSSLSPSEPIGSVCPVMSTTASGR